jgi:hypothetical protein
VSLSTSRHPMAALTLAPPDARQGGKRIRSTRAPIGSLWFSESRSSRPASKPAYRALCIDPARQKVPRSPGSGNHHASRNPFPSPSKTGRGSGASNVGGLIVGAKVYEPFQRSSSPLQSDPISYVRNQPSPPFRSTRGMQLGQPTPRTELGQRFRPAPTLRAYESL